MVEFGGTPKIHTPISKISGEGGKNTGKSAVEMISVFGLSLSVLGADRFRHTSCIHVVHPEEDRPNSGRLNPPNSHNTQIKEEAWASLWSRG